MEKTSSSNQPSLKYAWYALALLTLANISSFLDRQILALLVKPIKRDMHLSDTQVSLLMGLSFALFYTVFGIIIGRIADRANRRNIIAAGITVWSLMTALCAGVKNYTHFFLARMGVGVGEATLSPSAYSMITDYFPKKKLATAMSIFTMGIFIGSGLALAIGAGLVANLPKEGGAISIPVFGTIYHWQKLFLLIGLPGLLISLLMLTVREPKRKDVLSAGQDKQKLSLREALAIVFKHPKIYVSICLGTAFTAFVSYGVTLWTPTYFARTFNWKPEVAGLKFGLILMAGSVCGILWGGWYADKLKNNGIKSGRVKIGIVAAAGILCSFFIPLIPNPDIVLALLFFPAFFIASPMGASTSAIQEMMPNEVRALASAIFLFILNLIGIGLGPLVVATFTDRIFNDESAIRYSLAALFIIGGLLGLLFYIYSYRNYNKITEQGK